jgi:hypothetical protein
MVMDTKPNLQDRLFVALEEITAIAHEYAFDQAGLVQGPDNPPLSIAHAIQAARILLQEARETVYRDLQQAAE